MSVVEGNVEVRNRLGLHLRTATTLAEAVNRFRSTVTLGRGRNQVNARSVTGLLMLGAGQGTSLRVRVDGEDAKEAMAVVRELFATGFGED